MINKELVEVFSEIAREKNVERSELGSIIESLFLHLVERERGEASNCSVIVNLDKGEFEIYVEKMIVEDVEDPVMEITLDEISEVDSEMANDLSVGDSYIEIIDPMIFGRRMIHVAKQFFSQKLQDVEKKYIYEDYANRIGEIVIGTVHQIQRDNIFVNIEYAELRMPRKELIQSERYRRGDTIRAVIKSVEITTRGPDIVISRSDNHFLYKMFEMEVPEIEDGVIEIRSIARYPGERAKIIVQSHDRRIDPVGACVGMRGSRIQSVVRELNGEKIDIINWSNQPEILISRALAPAKPINLYIDEERPYVVAVFEDEELPMAIGKNGQNIKLASSVTEYTIDAVKKTEYEGSDDSIIYLDEVKGISAKQIEILSKAEIHTSDDYLTSKPSHLVALKGMGVKTVAKLKKLIQDEVAIRAENKNESNIEDKNELVPSKLEKVESP